MCIGSVVRNGSQDAFFPSTWSCIHCRRLEVGLQLSDVFFRLYTVFLKHKNEKNQQAAVLLLLKNQGEVIIRNDHTIRWT